MFPMTDTTRDLIRSNLELSTRLAQQAFDLQMEGFRISRKRTEGALDTFEQSIELGMRASRTMAAEWATGMHFGAAEKAAS